MKASRVKAKNYADDASLTKVEPASMRPLRDAFPELAEWSRKRRRAKKGEVGKQAVSIRLSPEVLAFFKAKGPGWQTRIDRTLMMFVEAAE